MLLTEAEIKDIVLAIKANAWRIDNYEDVYPELIAQAIVKEMQKRTIEEEQ